MNDKYINEEQDELDRVNDQAYAEQDYLHMQAENIERQLAEGELTNRGLTGLLYQIKAAAIKEAADLDWIQQDTEVVILRNDILNLADLYSKLAEEARKK
jgi:hypothetical protein